MAFVDYYKIMGVPKDYPQEKMKDAYKKRVRKFHPDLHPDDPRAKAKFQALQEANEVLSDPAKRQKYDQFGEHWREAGGFGGQGGPNGFEGGFGGFDFSQFGGGGGFSSFFEDLFGGGARRQGGGFGFRSQPEDLTINANVDIDMYTALLGGEIMIQTSSGKIKLKVKPETQNGTKVKLRGKGRLGSNGTVGDMVITYNVKLPTGLTAEQKDLLRRMQMAR